MIRVIRVSEGLGDHLDIAPAASISVAATWRRSWSGSGGTPAASASRCPASPRPRLPLQLLAGLVGEEVLVGLLIEGDQADAAVGLGGALVDLPSVPHERGGDGQGARLGRVIFPPDAATFATDGRSVPGSRCCARRSRRTSNRCGARGACRGAGGRDAASGGRGYPLVASCPAAPHGALSRTFRSSRAMRGT